MQRSVPTPRRNRQPELSGILRQMIQKLSDRVDSLLARRTARHDNAAPALRDRKRLIYEIGKTVTLDFSLDCDKQNGFLHESDS
jgi:hypothetical protein